MQMAAEPGWAIWRNVPAGYTGEWHVVSAKGWTYCGGFTNGRLICGIGLDPDTDEDTKQAWYAMLELTANCHESRHQPVLPIRTPARVLPFVSRAVGA